MGIEPARAEYTSTGLQKKKNCSEWGSNLRAQKILYKNCAQTLIGALFEL